jgi:DNA recombination protein RmuC
MRGMLPGADIPAYWLGALAGAVGAAMLLLWRARARATAARVRAEATLRMLEREHGVLGERLAGREQRIVELHEALAGERARADDLAGQAAAAAARAAELHALLEAERTQHARRERDLTDLHARLAGDFEQLSERVLGRRDEEGRARLVEMLGPLREQLAEFRRRVDDVHDAETRERATLRAELNVLREASDRVNREAGHLAQALKGEQRLQGAWGEFVLARVLEAAGLRRGHEFELQVSGRNADGDLLRPDAVVRLPGGRHVVVDAKVSLAAWERAVAATDDADRQRWLQQHVRDVREQVRRLAAKDYARLPQLATPDFVLLFLPIEGALAAVLAEDATFVGDAFARGVVPVSPTTLLLCLRIVENLWRRDQADRNVREIAARAGAIYDKVRLLVEDCERLGAQIGALQRAFEATTGRLWGGRGNLVQQVEGLRALGADVRREVPPAVVEQARAADAD